MRHLVTCFISLLTLVIFLPLYAKSFLPMDFRVEMMMVVNNSAHPSQKIAFQARKCHHLQNLIVFAEVKFVLLVTLAFLMLLYTGKLPCWFILFISIGSKLTKFTLKRKSKRQYIKIITWSHVALLTDWKSSLI